MKTVVKETLLPLLLVLFALIGGYYLFYGKEKQEEKMAQEEEVVQEQKLYSFADKYGAVVNWEKDLGLNGFTSEFQNVLISSKPFLFKGIVDDIYYKDENMFIRVTSLFDINFIQGYVLELECKKEIVEKILNQITEKYFSSRASFAVVATVNEVMKPMFEFNYSSEAQEKVLVDKNISGTVVIKGVCIDAEQIE